MKIYTPTELEPILKVKARTIRKLINKRELKASYVGMNYLVKEEDVQEYLERHRVFKY